MLGYNKFVLAVYVVLMIYIIVIYDGMCIRNMVNILCEVLFLTFMKTCLMEENGTYSALGVLFNGGKWYLQYVRCVVGLFVKGCGRFLVMEGV